jgi:hypothetical protein
MPIRTLTLQQAAANFITSYRDHLTPSSPARLIDPRNCTKCNSAFEDLIFALDGTQSSQTTFEQINGGLAFDPQYDSNIVELFGEARAK